MSDKRIIKVGSRKSELALIQTNYVISCLKKLYPDVEFELVSMTTMGDRVLNISLPKIGEKSLFTKDLEDCLANGTVDFVVHSLKDLPTCLPNGLAIGAVIEREDPRDALVLREDYKNNSLGTLPPGAIIGTSSLRRTAQLCRNYPHLKIVDIRGNLNTRLKKLDHHCSVKNPGSTDSSLSTLHPDYAALILAQAGLVRMGWQDRVSQVLTCSEMLYAVGQGAIAVECRADNTNILTMLAPLNHQVTYCRILTERSFLKTLGGGCSAPVAVSTTLKPFSNLESRGRKLRITGAVWSLDGSIKLEKNLECNFVNFQPKDLTNSKAVKHKLDVSLDDIEPRKIAKCPINHSGDSKNINNESNNVNMLSNNGDSVKTNATQNRDISDEITLESGRKIRTKGTIDDINPKNLKNCEDMSKKECPFKKQGDLKDPSLPKNCADDSKIVSMIKKEIVIEDINSSKITCCRQNKKLGQKSEPIDIENLINIHGKLFISCPYSMAKKNMSPMPVGQDFMGQCPYFDTSNISDDIELEFSKIHGKKDMYNVEKCPFISGKVSNNSPSCSGEKVTEVDTKRTDVELFCGLTAHLDIPIDIIRKCAEIGENLAKDLISEGALEVMKISQDYIHSSIGVPIQNKSQII